MRYELSSDPLAPQRRPALLTRPGLFVIAAALTALLGCAACSVAIVDRPPPAVIPLVVVVCIGCPFFAAWELPSAVHHLQVARRSRRRAAHTLARMRESLAALPETEHPLGL